MTQKLPQKRKKKKKHLRAIRSGSEVLVFILVFVNEWK